jgi:hypothetical protein
MLTGRSRWAGDADRSRHLTGTDFTVRIVSPRRRSEEHIQICATMRTSVLIAAMSGHRLNALPARTSVTQITRCWSVPSCLDHL